MQYALRRTLLEQRVERRDQARVVLGRNAVERGSTLEHGVLLARHGVGHVGDQAVLGHRDERGRRILLEQRLELALHGSIGRSSRAHPI